MFVISNTCYGTSTLSRYSSHPVLHTHRAARGLTAEAPTTAGAHMPQHSMTRASWRAVAPSPSRPAPPAIADVDGVMATRAPSAHNATHSGWSTSGIQRGVDQVSRVYVSWLCEPPSRLVRRDVMVRHAQEIRNEGGKPPKHTHQSCNPPAPTVHKAPQPRLTPSTQTATVRHRGMKVPGLTTLLIPPQSPT